MEQNRQNKWKEILMRDKVYLAIIAVLLIIIVVLSVKLAKAKGPEEPQGETGTQEQEDVQTGQDEETAEPEPENNLEENSHASIDKLVGKYCEYIASGDVEALEEIVDVLSDEEKEKIQNRAAFIEAFENVTCYTKNGPIEDSYIVFVCYDMKLINIETSAPDIICLYVGPKSDGGRRIHYGDIDESMLEYVAELEKDPEVQALYDDVSARYQEAQENDETLAAFIQKISGQVSEEEPEETEEEASESEENEEEASEEGEETQEEEASEEEEQGEATAQNRETRVTESVNIRSEASTESDRVALAYQGDAITQIESYDNGWSKVEYKGQTGYVKTEFLE